MGTLDYYKIFPICNDHIYIKVNLNWPVQINTYNTKTFNFVNRKGTKDMFASVREKHELN